MSVIIEANHFIRMLMLRKMLLHENMAKNLNTYSQEYFNEKFSEQMDWKKFY